VITLRNVDVGALVGTGSTLLYRIAQIGTLRTYVNVPQASVNAVHVGQPAALTVSHLPGRTFRGTVARTANALDPASRTMLVEVDVPNADGALFPGTYAEVDLSGSRPNPPLVVPRRRFSSGPTAPSRVVPHRPPCIFRDHRRARLRRSRRNPRGRGRDDDCRGTRRRAERRESRSSQPPRWSAK
jgi:hypothetical protein